MVISCVDGMGMICHEWGVFKSIYSKVKKNNFPSISGLPFEDKVFHSEALKYIE